MGTEARATSFWARFASAPELLVRAIRSAYNTNVPNALCSQLCGMKAKSRAKPKPAATSAAADPAVSAAPAPTCAVCFSEYEPQRPCITCTACGVQACRECVRAYLVSVLNPSCVQCHRHWDTTTLLACGVGQSWVNGPLRAHRETMLWDLEQARLPDTQPLALLMQAEHAAQQAYLEAQKALETCGAEFELCDVSCDHASYGELAARHDKLRRVKESKMYAASRAQRRVRTWIANAADPHHRQSRQKPANEVSAAAVVVQRCPQPDCLGFVTAGSMTCGMCAAVLCKRCRRVVVVGGSGGTGTGSGTGTGTGSGGTAGAAAAVHVCDPSDVATVKLLKSDTKPCPKCAAPIYKIDGCDQMWCTACHVAFSWTTGAVVETAIHNPHYFAFIRQGGIVQGPTGPVGGPACANGAPVVPAWVIGTEFGSVYRFGLHLLDMRMAPETNHVRLRGLFLSGAIDAKEFKRRVFLADRRFLRCQEAALITQTVGQVLIDLAAQYGARTLTCAEAVVQAHAIVEYANSCWQALARVHKVFFPAIRTFRTGSDYAYDMHGTRTTTRSKTKAAAAPAPAPAPDVDSEVEAP